MKKRIVSMLLAMLLLTMCAMPALAAAPKVKKVEYEGNGVVEVDFTTKNVRYKSAKVTVKDSAGKRLPVKILEKDSDDISFKVTGVKAGKLYTFTITGVRAGLTGIYGTVKGHFKTPSAKPTIKKVKYDADDRELEIDFATLVQYKNLKVTVKNSLGKHLTVRRIEKDTDGLELAVSGMIKGKKYTVTVHGVRVKGVGNYINVSKIFYA